MLEYVPIDTDVLVILVAALLYLMNLGRLLHINEVLLVCGTGTKWTAVTPADGFLFHRRFAVFPRLFDPGSIVLRFHWPPGSGERPDPGTTFKSDIERTISSLVMPRIVCMALLPEIFLGIPLCYTLPDHHWPLLSVILLIYIQILLLVAWLFLRRRDLELTWSNSVSLAFESIVCLPYAINFHRNVAERALHASSIDVLDAAEHLLEINRLNQLRDYVGGALDDWLERTHSESGISRRLTELRGRLHRRQCDEL